MHMGFSGERGVEVDVVIAAYRVGLCGSDKIVPLLGGDRRVGRSANEFGIRGTCPVELFSLGTMVL